MNIIEVKDLKKHYGTENVVKALDGVTLSIEKNTFTTIVGTSGSGKTTLLQIMSGLDSPTSGSVSVAGQDLSMMTPDQLTIYRRQHIGFIFQNYNLIPMLNAYENIIFTNGMNGTPTDHDLLDKVVHILNIEDKIHNYPDHLSGGQQQRVAIARALISKPDIIFADEPTGNLDSKNSKEVIELLIKTKQVFNQTIVMITHDEVIGRQSDRLIQIEDGKIVGGMTNGK